MQRQIVLAVLPELGLLAAAVAVAWLLLRLARGRPDWRHAARLPRDQRGAVQSLSFVLTVPLFIMVMMFIVQLSQLTIAKVVVEQAAVASARSAQVWIPADLTAMGEGAANHVVCLEPLGEMAGPDGWRYSRYLVPQAGLKYAKIRQAAVQAVIPICPSRATGVPLAAGGQQIANSLLAATYSYAPVLATNPMVPVRLMNKLAYAQGNTEVVIEVRHKETEPPLQTYLIGPYLDEFGCGEIGYHDQLIVTVTHNFALLPGPGRLLARRVSSPSGSMSGGSTGSTGGSTGGSTSSVTSGSVGYGLGSTARASGSRASAGPSYGSSLDPVADRIQNRNGVYVYALQATARVYNEGQKPRLGFRQSQVGRGVAASPAAVVPLPAATRAAGWRSSRDEDDSLTAAGGDFAGGFSSGDSASVAGDFAGRDFTGGDLAGRDLAGEWPASSSWIAPARTGAWLQPIADPQLEAGERSAGPSLPGRSVLRRSGP